MENEEPHRLTAIGLADSAEAMERGCRTRAEEHTLVAERWGRWNLLIGVPATALTAAAGATILASEDLKLLAGLVALLGAVLTAVVTFVAPARVSEKHERAASAFSSLSTPFWQLKKDARTPGFPKHQLNTRFTQLISRRDEIQDNSPLVPNWARRKAKRRLDEWEEDFGEE